MSGGPALIPELGAVGCPPELRAEIEGLMARYPDRHSAVIPALQAAQRRHGWLPPEAMRQVAAVMGVTPAYLESIASFYDMLKLEPQGENLIMMCTSITCHLRGASQVLAALEEATGAPAGGHSEDMRFQLEGFECLGACDIAPMASINGRYRGPLTPQDAQRIVDEIAAGADPDEVLSDKLSATDRPGGSEGP